MLAPDRAKALLAEWFVPQEDQRLAEGVKQLPSSLRKQAELLLGVDDDDSSARLDWQLREQQKCSAVSQMDSWEVPQRARVFRLIAPGLADVMESTWELLKTTPYQSGYSRKAFRAPHHPQFSVANRANWLEQMAHLGRRFRPETVTPQWLAAWAPHLTSVCHWAIERAIGPLLAAELNEQTSGANEAYEILRLSLCNQHDVGGMGRHVSTALLLSNRPEGWELLEKTLLAAQRQEGLRQAILETVDMSHPEAFRRMLRFVLEHDLIRFSSVVRAVDVWFGQLWAAASGGVVKKMLTQVVACLEDPAARRQALAGKDAEAAFLALWCEATEDAVASVSSAGKLLQANSREMRYVAARHLSNLDLDVASTALLPALRDEDLRIAILAVPAHGATVTPVQPAGSVQGAEEKDDVFGQLERLLMRLPDKPQRLKPLVWPWTEITVKRSQVAGSLLFNLGTRPATSVIPHLSKLETYWRRTAAERIVQAEPWDQDTRRAIVALAGDTSANVREVAIEALQKESLSDAEVQQLEGLLTRKSSDLRRGILAVLFRQNDAAALASGSRLLASRDAGQRLAGLELLRLMTDGQRSVAECRQTALDFRANGEKFTREQQLHLAEIAKDKVAVPTLSDALGLMNPAERSPAVPPRNRKATFITPAAVACLRGLDELIHEHRETSICITAYGSPQEDLLGNVAWRFPSPNFAKPREKQERRLPLADVWKTWFSERGKKLRDRDGLELLRARAWSSICAQWPSKKWNRWANSSAARKVVAETFSGGQPTLELRYSNIVAEIIDWLLFLFPFDAREALLDALESAYALVPAADMARLREPRKEDPRRSYYADDEGEHDWREAYPYEMWQNMLSLNLNASGLGLSPQQSIRLWQLLHWRDEPFPNAPRRRVEADVLFSAFTAGGAKLADVADHLLGPRGEDRYHGERFDLLAALTERQPSKQCAAWLAQHAEVRNLVNRALARILDLELSRGDASTAATEPAYAIRALWGCETLRGILHALGNAEFKLPNRWLAGVNQDRRQALTQLAKVTFPAAEESPQTFVELMKAAVRQKQFPEARLLQLTFLAPQWTKCVEAYLGWEQLSEGVYWFLAHMRSVGGQAENAAVASEGADLDDENETDEDTSTQDDESAATAEQRLTAWERLVLQRTPLTDAERNEGAIDVGWFRRTHALLGGRRWQALATAARFAANPAQAKRAQFIADVLLNRIKRKELIDGVTKKQLKEHVRLLGLLPLAAGNKRAPDLIERCQVLREYRRYANQLSGLTKPAALRAWETGMKNLAQTAGYADPLRLDWAVGAESVKDLARGPIEATAGGVTVTLSLDAFARPEIAIRKAGKDLKSIPAALKKDKKIGELTARVTDLKRQAAGIRQSLEAAMCRGDTFTRDELRNWCEHALLAPLLARLVVIGEGVLGYPDKGGKVLRNSQGKLEPLKANEALRLAHPYDLLATGAWHDWQRECFRTERVQPFKQIFRELYVLTGQEKKDGYLSHRYDGQQVQPTQALALLGHRGWNTGEGVFKVFHDEELTAQVYFQSGVTTPAEVEAAALAGIGFARHVDWKPVKLSSVPPRLFSEVMRDLDLVVSVAHAGGVDPEASASTLEMRAGLVRETCALLKLNNVRLKANHAVVDGELAQYSVHLGSGTVHRLPGGALCIVPVHAQHRGRLFLPFADDDLRTAEVVSKVLLLARDREIQDPIILEQIRA